MPIIIQVCGGLGNQMFTYAFGRALSLRNGDELVLDHRTGFERDFYRREFGLGVFQAPHRKARCGEGYWGPVGRLRRKVARTRARRGSGGGYVLEPVPRKFEPSIAGLETKGRKVVFDGYWQSPRYFDDFADQIRADFSIAAPLDEATRRTASLMEGCDPVCLHARRLRSLPAGGTLAEVAGGDPQVPAAYYPEAALKLVEGLANPHLFCFGDAPEWFGENLKLDLPVTIVQGARGDALAYQDLFLMSRCRRIAIANSSFSWWAGWLINDPEKRVFYPRCEDWDWTWNQDLIPAGWIPLECGPADRG